MRPVRADTSSDPRGLYLILATCNFVIGMGAFALVGMLEPMAEGLAVPVTSVGALLTVYSVAYAVTSPVLVALTGSVGRRRVLALGLTVFALATLVAALSPGLGLLYPARIAAAAGAGMVSPVALAIAAALAPPDKRGQALASVFLGITLSQVAGVPVGSWIAYTFGWRSVFGLVTTMALPCIWLVWTRVPAGLRFSPVSLADLGRVLRDPVALATVGFTAVFIGALYVVYTYLPPLLSQTMGYGRDGISLALLLFGIGAPIGNIVGGRMADRLGPARSLVLICVVEAACLPLFALLPVPGALLLGFVFFWSLVGWCFSPSQQLRLVSLAPELGSVLMALHAASIYIGIAAGSAVGGLVMATGGPLALGPVAAVVVLAALGVLIWSDRAARRRAGDL
ncbi:MFS transporter [Maliponia aquimaris]|uniref:Purine efflux pump PbuE n=1 Tax=Maliponia aquimaris TaxID=1673631 RepID=A0A238KCX1_9RHOB|nr:MFS transporter [Maliponia aquimaris]SMX40675.1 Purine efflux pump PbuE [Maliponia aquimaris]